MRKTRTLLLSLCCLFVCAVGASAQEQPNRYRFDNFDTGVNIPREEIVTTDQLPAANAPTNTARGKNSRRSGRAINQTPEQLQQQRSALNLAAALRNRPIAPLVQNTAASTTVSQVLVGYTTGNQTFDTYIVDSGTRNGVDPVLLYAIMHQESAFKPRAVSNKGAGGLMQMMPATAARFGLTNRFDPRQSIEGGARYMRFLLDFFNGDVRLALAGYNAGEGAVLKYGRQIPPYRETQEYVRRITARYQMMRDPQTARRAQTIPQQQVTQVVQQTATPPTVYETSVLTVRLPDGKLRLMSQ